MIFKEKEPYILQIRSHISVKLRNFFEVTDLWSQEGKGAGGVGERGEEGQLYGDRW